MRKVIEMVQFLTLLLQVIKCSGMEGEWAELLEQATAWQHQLEEAEAGLSQLEAELNGLVCRLEGMEAESTAWCLPPSLDSARAELEELETAMVGLQELQEQVDSTRATASRLPPALAREAKVSEVERRLSALQDAAAARRSQLVVLQVFSNINGFGSLFELMRRCRRSLEVSNFYHEALLKVGRAASPSSSSSLGHSRPSAGMA